MVQCAPSATASRAIRKHLTEAEQTDLIASLASTMKPSTESALGARGGRLMPCGYGPPARQVILKTARTSPHVFRACIIIKTYLHKNWGKWF